MSEDVVPLKAVAPGVSGLRVLLSNVFALTDETGWTLIRDIRSIMSNI